MVQNWYGSWMACDYLKIVDNLRISFTGFNYFNWLYLNHWKIIISKTTTTTTMGDDIVDSDEIYGLIFAMYTCSCSICRFAFLSLKINKLVIHIFTFHNFYWDAVLRCYLSCSSWKTRIKILLRPKKKTTHTHTTSKRTYREREWTNGEYESSANYAARLNTDTLQCSIWYLVVSCRHHFTLRFKFQVSMLITQPSYKGYDLVGLREKLHNIMYLKLNFSI